MQQHRHVHLAELEDDRVGVGRLDLLDVLVLRLARGDHARRRIDDALVGGLDVLGGEVGAVVELDALAQLEGVGEAVLGDLPGLGEVALDLELVVRTRERQQRGVLRRHRVHHGERRGGVAVGGRRLGHHGEVERAAALGRLGLQAAPLASRHAAAIALDVSGDLISQSSQSRSLASISPVVAADAWRYYRGGAAPLREAC